MLPAVYYHGVFYTLILLLCLIQGLKIYQYSTNTLLYRNHNEWRSAVLLSIILVLFIGTRPIHAVFADTVGYAVEYNSYFKIEINEKRSEWIWVLFANFCKDLGLSVYVWFTFIAFLYIVPMLLACKRWFFSQNVYLAMLFVFSAFSFFAYGVNGLRNGIACSFVICAMSLYLRGMKDKVMATLLCLVGFFVHKSIALPIVCFLVSYYLIKKFWWPLAFWFFSIFLSLNFGSSIVSLLEPLMGFDQRFTEYLSASADQNVMQGFAYTGFRWDFLLYSCVPILLGYYVLQKRKVQDRIYLLLMNTYVLANAFWIIVINASFSNRFAYLSWFLYPIVLSYPLLRMSIWKNQGRKTAYILIAHSLFTYLMWLIK